jgi:GT2 family glycosyltransferase
MVEWFFGLFVGRDRKLNGRIVGWINRLGVIFGNYDQPGTCVINSPRGCNMAVRRELFLKIGGFNNKFIGNAWGFEADFGLRWAREGRYGRYVGDAIVIHQEVPMGGTRQASKAKWIRDYIYNNKLLIKNIGPQAWLGSVPRLVKNTLWRRIVKLFL